MKSTFSAVTRLRIDTKSNVDAARRRLAAAIECAEKEKRKRKGGNDPYYPPSHYLEETIRGALAPNEEALVTRNHYGCLVLNAVHALFIDVDIFVPSKLYNPIEGRNDRLRPLRQQMLSDLRTVLRSVDDYGFRVYRTAGGFRILATTDEFEPGSKHTERLMNLVGADRDFVDLCRRQRNFRARLTPKPWRCGLRRPPNLFPRKSARAEQRFETWLTQYGRACDSRATCDYVGHVGREYVHDRIRPVIEFHDHASNASSALPLA
jgi:hypothetical protein